MSAIFVTVAVICVLLCVVGAGALERDRRARAAGKQVPVKLPPRLASLKRAEEDSKAAAETELQILRPLADQGNAEAQAKLGLMYLGGEGLPQDYAQGVACFRKSADQGNADGL
jgi:TPR repeat protein